MITISLCMILKNEEGVLARCLDSLVNVVDEIILVDTGSTDRTKEIALQYTSQVYDYPWKDDFADARNFSFAKATKDYIYTADADEILDSENQLLFLQLKELLLPEIEIVQMLYCNQLEFGTTYNFDEEYRPKLYKRLRHFTWIDPIHESINLNPVIYDSDIRIQHKPLSRHEKRDFRIFEKLTSTGETLSSKLCTMYTKELLMCGTKEDFVAAAPFFSALLADTKLTTEQLRESLCMLCHWSYLVKDVPLLMKYALKAIALEAPSEVCYTLGLYYQDCQDYEEAILWYYNAAYETHALLSFNHETSLPLHGLIQCYEAIGDTELAHHYTLELKKGKDSL